MTGVGNIKREGADEIPSPLSGSEADVQTPTCGCKDKNNNLIHQEIRRKFISSHWGSQDHAQHLWDQIHWFSQRVYIDALCIQTYSLQYPSLR